MADQGAMVMLSRLKSIFSVADKKEEQQAALPEVRPFGHMEPEAAPAPIHKPDHLKIDINHAGHMRVIARSDEEVKSLAAEALKLAREKKTITYGDDSVSAYISDLACLKFLTVTKNSDTLCTYPFFNMGKPVDVRVTEVTECQNGYEGQLEIYTKGSALTFFDTLYFKNKNTYFPGKDATVLLSGIAYVLTKTKAADHKKPRGQELTDSDLAFRYENGDVDDYVFSGKVKDVWEFQASGKKAQAIKVALRTGADSVIDIYVCATENAIREKVRKGDHVSGIVWLQGFIL
jgi:hypothetical protein